jgi:hypothetical protein
MPLTCINQPRREPLWKKFDPIKPDDFIQRIGVGRKIYAIAEPERGYLRREFPSIAAAARDLRISVNLIQSSLSMGHRAGGRIFWYCNMVERLRPRLKHASHRNPVIVDGVKYMGGCMEAAAAIGMNAGTFGNQMRKYGVVMIGKRLMQARYL